ncbi:solute carrier family 35 member E1 homolog [Amphibalanus amphitrite]|uniref:solute carrier family 35 member E1 homolog n=1 Tax=Amphibalanus amphitrite TaxID=1232801 RepID=UPI001C8FC149|nr:solute carrier family 35 member E1 homolog [Amphibalanus amphitrite]XP_043237065.1 solute carrier family 35 member E1 homolog [Amphibalanus amphitrite]XP_043237066.1 solute carrier family 35 member E1 homolog [Amphibalanus amphitrite]
MSLTLAEKKEFVKLVCLCLLWYAISSVNNVVGKTLLNYFPYPNTLSMVQLLSITVYSEPILRCLRIRPHSDMSWSYYVSVIVPLATGKFLAVLFSHISIWKVPLSYAHTVKATMPIFTVIFGRVLLGERQTFSVYCSLIPIVVGVGIATITELSFDIIGLLSALTSIAVYSVMQLFSKKTMKDTGIHHLRLLLVLGRLAFFMFLPFWVMFDLRKLMVADDLVRGDSVFFTLMLLATDGFLNWMQNLVAFTVLHLVTPLTYAVCNATKRVSVISASLLFMRNPVTVTNVVGMLLAIAGVFMYNKAKYEANLRRRQEAILPMVTKGNPLLHGGTIGIDWADKISPVYQPLHHVNHHGHGHANGYSNGFARTVMAA